jgi:hypothetical protein
MNGGPEFGNPQELLDWFVTAAERNEPVVCSYRWYYTRVLNPGFNGPWSQAYPQQAIRHAMAGPRRALRGLGSVRLDTFIVGSGNRRPGVGHWATVEYEEANWVRVLGSATLLH